LINAPTLVVYGNFSIMTLGKYCALKSRVV
jgi:hypothetical protein